MTMIVTLHHCTWITCLLLHIITCSGSTYTIGVPREYVAFTGDLIINYTLPAKVSLPHGFIKLLALSDKGRREITIIKIGGSAGSGRITCGLIEFAGRHILEMHSYVDGEILMTKEFTVRWPRFRMYLPEMHTAQSVSVDFRYTSEARCVPLLQRYSFQIDLEYRQESQFNPSFYDEQPVIIHSEPLLDISQTLGQVTYSCELFDLKGSYRTVLRSSYDMNATLAKSNIMDVQWSDKYDVRIFSQSVHPCVGHLSVLYVHPQCSGAKDKIRMYVLRRDVSGSLAAPLDRVYVTERYAHPDKTYVVFECDLFPITAVGFCFVYVSMSSSGVVTEQHSSCISAHKDAVLPVDGGWSEWGRWGTCSVTCNMGKRSRYRSCNNPSPAHGGQYCKGFPTQFEPCFSLCPDAIPKTPLHTPKYNQECACGCELNMLEGEIIGTGRCNGLSLWLLTVNEENSVRLNFQYLKLYEDKQWVKVRDGGSADSNLLAVSFGEAILTEVTSSTNKMLIEFMSKSETSVNSSGVMHHSSRHPNSSTLYPHSPTKKIHVHGFIANFSAILRNQTVTLTAVQIQPSPPDGTMWESTVTIVGISLCVVIVIVALTVALYHKCIRKGSHKYSMAATIESPTHVPKSTSMHSTPSHHSALSGIEIDYDMERPLTGQGKQKSRASSISSVRSNGRSNNKKRLKSKSELEPGGSPKPPTKHYSPLPSPQVKAARQGDEEHSLFNTSPLLNRKPRSPKVHPSTKFKHKPDIKSPLSPPFTKHDLLTRKRFDSEHSQDRTPTNGYMDLPKGPLSVTPLSTGSATPTTKVFCAEINPVQPDRNDVQYNKLEVINKTDPEDVRKPGSGTSDDSQSPDKSQIATHQTTSFIEKPDSSKDKTKPRRPTSLTESYSMHTFLPNGSDKKSVSSDGSHKMPAPIDRHNDLPKPDGQSPKTPREECSKTSTPKSVHSSKSRQTLSPSRSVTTPSDNLEMEYDDFVDYDDTYSYFDPIETEKLQWRGAEKLGKRVSNDDD